MIPGARSQSCTIRCEGECGDRTFVAGELIEELPSLDRPHVDVKGVVRGCTDNFSGGVNCERGEGEARRRGEGAKVAIAEHVPCTNRAIERGGEEYVASFRVLGSCDGRAVLGEGSDMKA